MQALRWLWFTILFFIPTHSWASSSSARKSDNIGMGTRAGTLIGGILGVGIDVWWQVSTDFQLGLFYGSGQVDLSSAIKNESQTSYIETTKADLYGSLAFLEARQFLGNSFYITAAAGYRPIRFDYRVDDTVS